MLTSDLVKIMNHMVADGNVLFNDKIYNFTKFEIGSEYFLFQHKENIDNMNEYKLSDTKGVIYDDY